MTPTVCIMKMEILILVASFVPLWNSPVIQPSASGQHTVVERMRKMLKARKRCELRKRWKVLNERFYYLRLTVYVCNEPSSWISFPSWASTNALIWFVIWQKTRALIRRNAIHGCVELQLISCQILCSVRLGERLEDNRQVSMWPKSNFLAHSLPIVLRVKWDRVRLSWRSSSTHWICWRLPNWKIDKFCHL